MKKQYFTTKCDILPQRVILPQSVVIPINYPTTNCNISLQNIVDYHKKIKFYKKMLHFTTMCYILP